MTTPPSMVFMPSSVVVCRYYKVICRNYAMVCRSYIVRCCELTVLCRTHYLYKDLLHIHSPHFFVQYNLNYMAWFYADITTPTIILYILYLTSMLTIYDED